MTAICGKILDLLKPDFYLNRNIQHRKRYKNQMGTHSKERWFPKDTAFPEIIEILSKVPSATPLHFVIPFPDICYLHAVSENSWKLLLSNKEITKTYRHILSVSKCNRVKFLIKTGIRCDYFETNEYVTCWSAGRICFFLLYYRAYTSNFIKFDILSTVSRALYFTHWHEISDPISWEKSYLSFDNARV